jgi:hypothetical protein
MTPRRLQLDFVRAPARVSRPGLVLLALGVVVVTATLLDYRRLAATVAGLELQLAAVAPPAAAGEALDENTVRVLTEAGGAIAELSTPWSRLLADLETAGAGSAGDLAVLTVEPDRAKHQVRILAEARSLAAALAYVQRLQRSQALGNPMLESHEVRSNDRDHPVRVQIAADWRLVP